MVIVNWMNTGGGKCFSISRFFLLPVANDRSDQKEWFCWNLTGFHQIRLCSFILVLSHSAGALPQTGSGGLACWQDNRNTPLSPTCHVVMCSSKGHRYGFFFMFVDYLTCWEGPSAQDGLWVLFVRFLWMCQLYVSLDHVVLLLETVLIVCVLSCNNTHTISAETNFH